MKDKSYQPHNPPGEASDRSEHSGQTGGNPSIEPYMVKKVDSNPLKEILKIVINTWGPCDLWPDDVVEEWLEKDVFSENGAWAELFEQKVCESIDAARTGERIHDALEYWRRYGS